MATCFFGQRLSVNWKFTLWKSVQGCKFHSGCLLITIICLQITDGLSISRLDMPSSFLSGYPASSFWVPIIGPLERQEPIGHTGERDLRCTAAMLTSALEHFHLTVTSTCPLFCQDVSQISERCLCIIFTSHIHDRIRFQSLIHSIPSFHPSLCQEVSRPDGYKSDNSLKDDTTRYHLIITRWAAVGHCSKLL